MLRYINEPLRLLNIHRERKFQCPLPGLQQYMKIAKPAATLKQARKNVGPREEKTNHCLIKAAVEDSSYEFKLMVHQLVLLLLFPTTLIQM